MPDPPRRTADATSAAGRLADLLAAEPDARADALVEIHRFADLATLAAHTGGGRPNQAVVAGSTAVAPPVASSLVAKAANLVAAYHRKNPLRPGMPLASLASALDVDQDVLDALLAGASHLRVEGAVVAASSFSSGLTEAQEAAFQSAAAQLRAAGLNVPRVTELGLDDELLHAVLRQGRLVRISEEFAYLPEQVDEILARLGDLPSPFTVAEFRDAYAISRKYAVPLLEWLDRRNATVRRGDVRLVKASG